MDYFQINNTVPAKIKAVAIHNLGVNCSPNKYQDKKKVTSIPPLSIIDSAETFAVRIALKKLIQ